MSPAPLVVAVDGPSGSGKSTISRAVASRLGLRYLDTGATYRALTWLALQRGVDVADAEATAALAADARLEVGTDPDAPWVRVDGHDVTTAVRGADVTAAVSAVSASPGVRERLVAFQRETAAAVAGGADDHVAATRADLARRDRLDSGRTASPLVRAPRAVELDSTDLGIPQVVDRVVELCEAAVAAGSRA